MSERGKYASVVYNDPQTGELKYDYAYHSTHEDIYPDPNGIVLSGALNATALIQDKDDVAFLSSY